MNNALVVEAMSVEAVSETDVLVRFNAALSPALIQQLRHWQLLLQQQLSVALIDSVLAYRSLLLCFSPQDPRSPQQRVLLVKQQLEQLMALPPRHQTQHQTMILPVYYGPEAGADFTAVCQKTQLSAEALIELHSTQSYYVYALGFSPGFAFLGELPEALQLPRRKTPRTSLPAGSVAIAHNQTAVYPQPSPGGWRLIGRCPTSLFSTDTSPPNLLSIGDEVKFQPISRDEFLQLGGEL